MPSRSNLLLRALVIFVALFALMVGYFWVHKPFDAGVVARLGGALIDALTAAALLVIGGGIGRAALARVDLSPVSRAERVALEGGIGLGLIALGALLLGLIGLFRPPLLWALLLGLTVLRVRALVGWLGDSRSLLRSVRAQWGAQRLVIGYCVVMLALALLIAVAPPTHWDSLTYHLIAAQRYTQAGAIQGQPDNFYLGLSENVEMLYGLTTGLFGRATAGAPVHFAIGLLALLATAGVTRRFAGRAAGWWAVLLLLSAFNLWALFGWAYVDLGTLLYGALALSAASAWRERRSSGWLIVLGAIVGLAMGVKYTTLALGVAIGLFVLIHEPRRVVRNGAILVVAAVLAFAPWALKGLLLYHNPIYPFIFNGLNWNADRAAAFNFSAYSMAASGALWQLPILPIAATIFGLDRVDGYGFTIGPWLLTLFLLLPLVWAFLDARARRLALDALSFIIPLTVFWAVMAATSSIGIQTRLMIMALPAFAVAGAVALYGLGRFPRKPVDINFIVRGVLALTIALTLVDAVRDTVAEDAVPYLTAQISMDQFMYDNTGAYYGAMTHLPAGSRVLLMWEPRGFYCPPTVTCTADVLFDNWKLPQIAEKLTPDGVFARYRSEYDYLLFFGSLYDQYLEFSTYPALDRTFPAERDQRMTPVWTDGIRYTLYGWQDGT